MTGPEHYQEAETQAESAARAIDDRMFDDARVSLRLAQVHATLALAAATAGGSTGWHDVLDDPGQGGIGPGVRRTGR